MLCYLIDYATKKLQVSVSEHDTSVMVLRCHSCLQVYLQRRELMVAELYWNAFVPHSMSQNYLLRKCLSLLLTSQFRVFL